MGRVTVPVSFVLRLDGKRRPTLPQALLDEAGVGPDQGLVAHVDGPGRIVLEATNAVLANLQAVVRAGKHEANQALADELLQERADDTSLAG